jgi:hypothetical protein
MLIKTVINLNHKIVIYHMEHQEYLHTPYCLRMSTAHSMMHCKKNWSENKSLFRIPIPRTVFSISVIQNLCSSPLSFFKIIEVEKRTLTLLMETNSISLSKK